MEDNKYWLKFRSVPHTKLSCGFRNFPKLPLDMSSVHMCRKHMWQNDHMSEWAHSHQLPALGQYQTALIQLCFCMWRALQQPYMTHSLITQQNFPLPWAPQLYCSDALFNYMIVVERENELKTRIKSEITLRVIQNVRGCYFVICTEA